MSVLKIALIYAARARTSSFIYMLVLLLALAVIYLPFIVNGHYFPGDFSYAYHAQNVFFTSSLRQGIFPEWMPFQRAGYPLALNLQTAFYSPVYWVFALSTFTLTLQINSIIQILHEYLGVIGMFFFLTTLYHDKRLCLLGATAFMFFGGFFSNAIHPDYVRGFAIAPWLLYCLNVPDTEGSTDQIRKFLILPLVIYLIFAEAYPGQIVAFGLISMCFLVFTTAMKWNAVGIWRRNLLIGGAALVGLSMASVTFVPGLLLSSHMVRSQLPGVNQLQSFKLLDMASLVISPAFTSHDALHDITMFDSFVTLPVIVLVCFVRTRDVITHRSLFAIMVVAFVIALGYSTPVWGALAAIVPAAGISRFVYGDYKVFVAIAIIAIALSGLSNIVGRELSLRCCVYRSCIGVLLSAAIVTYSQVDEVTRQVVPAWSFQTELILTASIYVITSLLFAAYISRRVNVSAMLVMTFVLIVTSGMFHAYSLKVLWIDENASYSREVNAASSSSKCCSYQVIKRGAREEPLTPFPVWMWKGYYDGSFMMSDWGGVVLKSMASINEQSTKKSYLLEQWTPILLKPGPPRGGTRYEIDETVMRVDAHSGSEERVRQRVYSINTIQYDVDVRDDMLLVENEVFFPGWSAKLLSSDGTARSISAVEVNNLFRGWLLPEGKYLMVAEFKMPYLRAFRLISVMSCLFWLLAIGTWALRTQHDGGR